MKIFFNEWRYLYGYHVKKSIVNISIDEDSIKEFVDMLSFFILRVPKKDGSLHLPTRYYFLSFSLLLLLLLLQRCFIVLGFISSS